MWSVLFWSACSRPSGPPAEDPTLPTDETNTTIVAGSDLSCQSVADCGEGELCVDATCTIDRCGGIVGESRPPLGQGLTFLDDLEFGVAENRETGGSYRVDTYHPVTGPNFDQALDAGTAPVVDVAGGHFDGTIGQYATTTADGAVRVLGTSMVADLGFAPVAIDAGDIDGDGLDELVAIAADDQYAVCDLDLGTCTVAALDAPTHLVDLTVGDLDRDNVEEPIFLVDAQGERSLRAIGRNLGWDFHIGGDEYVRLAAADVDGDWISELVVLSHPWCGDLCDDELYVYDALPDGTFARRFWSEVDGETAVVDLAAGDVDHDDIDEVIGLLDDARIALLDAGTGRFTTEYRDVLESSDHPDRIAMADHDGDSPRARLVDGPERVGGAVVPMVVMALPPYDRVHSEGASSVSYGDSTSAGESFSDTVSLSLSADVGVGANFLGVFGTSLSTKTSWSTSNTLTTGTTTTLGSRYSLSAQPDVFGDRYGGVVVGWGCFDAYLYELDDPTDVLGGDGEPIVVTVPVGGGQALYDTDRYNALAEAGGMPRIELPFLVGDPSTYPTVPEKLDGTPIDERSVLFPDPQAFTVSDVGDIGWFSSVSESASNTESTSSTLGVSAGVTAFGVSVGGGVTDGWGQTYGLTVGSTAQFTGDIPPLPDDSATPEDEYARYQYSVTPWVYRDTWSDPEGNEAHYWVMTYQVGD